MIDVGLGKLMDKGGRGAEDKQHGGFCSCRGGSVMDGEVGSGLSMGGGSMGSMA